MGEYSTFSPASQRPNAWALKRAFDVVASTAALAALGPVLAAVGVLVRLDSPGPALFVQERVGLHGRVFRLYKFRTMATGAPVRFNSDGSTRIEQSDARVTRVGAFLRGGLDELPQLYNVLLGDMSIVGPRPDMPVHAEAYNDRERTKLSVRPGMTSLAAVLGRNAISWKRRIAIDLDYIHAWSPLLDMRIILATVAMAVGRAPFRFDDVTTLERSAQQE